VAPAKLCIANTTSYAESGARTYFVVEVAAGSDEIFSIVAVRLPLSSKSKHSIVFRMFLVVDYGKQKLSAFIW